LLVRFSQVSGRVAADELRGRLLVVPESMLPELPKGSYWPHELEGCEVVTDAGRSLGTLVEVVANPANDLWVARDEAGAETLVPAVRDVIVEVDTAGKHVVVREIPGLTAPEG
jgi:16S rRNA processing protein RimM